MAVAIKLKRIGKTLKPVYRVVVIHSKKTSCQKRTFNWIIFILKVIEFIN